MKKYFLLIAGDDYYPANGTYDWQGCYETYDAAYDAYLKLDRCYDWHNIVDLREWMNKKILKIPGENLGFFVSVKNVFDDK